MHTNSRIRFLSFAVLVLACGYVPLLFAEAPFRPPAVPLIACDPYFSVWSQASELTATQTTHWTGKPQPLTALLKVDDTTYRLMGVSPESLPAMEQVSLEVLPTRTIYRFASATVEATLTFTTPALPDDVLILSRPTTYITCDVKSLNSQTHRVQFYFDASGELATNTPDQQVIGTQQTLDNALALQIGTVSQQVLGKQGDDLRIDWGYLYVAVPKAFQPHTSVSSPDGLRNGFINGSEVAPQPSGNSAVASEVAVGAWMDLGNVATDAVSRYVVVAYDDLYSIEYMRTKLRPYWRKDGWEAANLLEAAVAEYESLMSRCQQFDSQLMADLEQQGGAEYARIAALAYRQCFAAGKFVADANGQPLQFCKENHSNGCIATSDVFYPMSPQFLLLSPTLTKSVLVPFMNYAASDRWKFPFAPHDLGTYPKANGQVYGGGEVSPENQMPVEESGNLLILFGALAKIEGNADFAALYWDQLTQWANYLKDKGFDPENQLCTDDFAGHMAHNVNLSAKAIVGLGSYAMLCDMREMQAESDEYQGVAKRYAEQWVAAARDGEHFRLAFDQPGTWSQKYNLVWDRILDLGLFPEEVFTTEMAFYRKTQNEFGLPLDNRSDYTKLDWISWTATLTEDRDDFHALIKPVYHFLNVTPDRSPMTDWYFTTTAKKRGFTARPVVGGVFLKMLYDQSIWSRYASQDTTQAAGWAAMPVPPQTVRLIPTSENDTTAYRYTTTQPESDWFTEEYADGSWKEGPGGLGRTDGPIQTPWETSDIWVRRVVEIRAPVPERVALRIWHDEDAQVYINGELVCQLSGYSTGYEVYDIPAKSLKPGKNVVAIHCHQTSGGQFIDFGLDAVQMETKKAIEK